MKVKGKLILISMVSVLAIAVLGVFWSQSFQNKAYRLEENIKLAKADISVQEKKRAELIPNLVDCVKEYDKHEYETLMALVEARGTNSDEVADEVQTVIAAVVEAYPELKSTENYQELMRELTMLENAISNYRENYNRQIDSYKSYVRQFPARNMLNMLGYEAQEFEYLDYDTTYSNAPTNIFGE